MTDEDLQAAKALVESDEIGPFNVRAARALEMLPKLIAEVERLLVENADLCEQLDSAKETSRC